MVYYIYMFMLATIVFATVCFLCVTLWSRFRPLTSDEEKIFDSFNIALQNNGYVKVGYSVWASPKEEYIVSILEHTVLVSSRLGRLLNELYLKRSVEQRKTEHSKFAEAIYSKVIERYPNAPTRFQHGSFKGSATPLTSRPDAPQPQTTSLKKMNKVIM